MKQTPPARQLVSMMAMTACISPRHVGASGTRLFAFEHPIAWYNLKVERARFTPRTVPLEPGLVVPEILQEDHRIGCEGWQGGVDVGKRGRTTGGGSGREIGEWAGRRGEVERGRVGGEKQAVDLRRGSG